LYQAWTDNGVCKRRSAIGRVRKADIVEDGRKKERRLR